MILDKSTGPDGVNFEFIKQFWELVEPPDFKSFVDDFHANGRIVK